MHISCIMCLVWLSEKHYFSLRTKLITFVNLTGCLLHGPNWIFKPNSGYLVSLHGRLPRRPGFDPTSVHVRFVLDESDTGIGFSSNPSLFACRYHSTAVYSSSCTSCFYQKDKRANTGRDPSIKQCCVENQGALGRKVLGLFFCSVIPRSVMAEAFSCRLFTAEARVRSDVSPFEFCGG